MRMHIEVDDELMARVDRLAGSRGRSAFVRAAIEQAVRSAARWSDLEVAAGSIPDAGHEWDPDPARWVRDQRQGDARRAG